MMKGFHVGNENDLNTQVLHEPNRNTILVVNILKLNCKDEDESSTLSVGLIAFANPSRRNG